jgi:hypothetical protein
MHDLFAIPRRGHHTYQELMKTLVPLKRCQVLRLDDVFRLPPNDGALQRVTEPQLQVIQSSTEEAWLGE